MAQAIPNPVNAGFRARARNEQAIFEAKLAVLRAVLAAEFHALWNRGNDDPERRFLLEKNPQLSRARLELAMGIAQIIRSGLDLMGVAATEEMR